MSIKCYNNNCDNLILVTKFRDSMNYYCPDCYPIYKAMPIDYKPIGCNLLYDPIFDSIPPIIQYILRKKS